MAVPITSSSAASLAETLPCKWEQRARTIGAPAYEAARQPVRALFRELCELCCSVAASASRTPTNGTQPQDIRLRFEPVLGRYALSYRLHPS